MNSISPNTLLLGAIIVFALGAIVGGKIVTALLFRAFGSHRREPYIRDRRPHRPYDDDGDDGYHRRTNHNGLFLLALISLVIGGIGIKKALNNAGETSVSSKGPDTTTIVTEISSPSRVPNSAEVHNNPPKSPQIFDPEYKPTPTTSSEPSVVEAPVGEEYIVQLDAYSQKSNADKQMAGLQAKGFPTGYFIKERGEGIIYVVYAGPYHSDNDANWSNRTYFGNRGLVKVAGDLELNRY